MQKINGYPKNLVTLLGSRYFIPYYQREYKWEKKQMLELVEDLSDEFLNNYQVDHGLKDVDRYGMYFLGPVTLYHFGILTSNAHMAWMRTVAGRLEMRYRYSKDIVYNNFIWPDCAPEQKARIEQTAQGILDTRAKYPDDSYADLYDDTAMPFDLRRAHQDNDRAVWEAYGRAWPIGDEAACVARLMKLYQARTSAMEPANSARAAV